MKWSSAGLLVVWVLVMGLRVQAASAQTLLAFTPEERARIAAHGPWPLPRVVDASNRADGRAPAIHLGRQLFFDKRLSRDGKLACASCHVPARAFQDGLPVAQGRLPAQRNTPSLLDASQRRWLGWDGAHDTLWAASLAPLLAAAEMSASPAQLAAQMRAQPRWAAAYRAAFGAPATADDEAVVVNLAKALAAYQATLVSPRTPFDEFRDAFLRGDTPTAARYPLAAQRGLRLFIGQARCHLCHAGPAFSNGEFADVGVPFSCPAVLMQGGTVAWPSCPPAA